MPTLSEASSNARTISVVAYLALVGVSSPMFGILFGSFVREVHMEEGMCKSAGNAPRKWKGGGAAREFEDRNYATTLNTKARSFVTLLV